MHKHSLTLTHSRHQPCKKLNTPRATTKIMKKEDVPSAPPRRRARCYSKQRGQRRYSCRDRPRDEPPNLRHNQVRQETLRGPACMILGLCSSRNYLTATGRLQNHEAMFVRWPSLPNTGPREKKKRKKIDAEK